MKRLLVLMLVILCACTRQPQAIAKRNIEAYLKQKLHNPPSFELITVQNLTKDWLRPAVDSGFTSLDSGLAVWAFVHQKSKTDYIVIKSYVDSLNKARPDLTRKNNRNLKLMESGKLTNYWTNCLFRIGKNQIKQFVYEIELDTNYKVINSFDLTNKIIE